MSDTIYAEDAAPLTLAPADLPGRADAVVVGGGLTGLSAALRLAQAGRSVAVLEAGAIGEGASGRNGGQLHPGQRRDQLWLSRHLGPADADRLWRLGEEAVAHVHELIARHAIDCGFRPGLIEAAHTPRAFDEARAYAEHLGARYGVRSTMLDRDALAAAIGTARYVGGVRTAAGGHLDPLALVRGLAAAAERAGATLLPHHAATRLARAGGAPAVAVGSRTIRADAVLLAGNGLLTGLDRRLDARILPLVNHVAATRPLPQPLIAGGEAVSDTRRVVRYFRQDRRGRLIFGGGESLGAAPRDVAARVRPYLADVYPQLADVAIERAWSGTLGLTRTRCPLIRRLEPGIYAAAGYSGQGVGLASFAGRVVAEAILGDGERLDAFARLPVPPLPGGRHAKAPLAALAMAWFSLRDRLALPARPGPPPPRGRAAGDQSAP